MTQVFELVPDAFAAEEKPLAEHGGVTVSTFRYDSGVDAVRVKADRVEAVILPFYGQQIWHLWIDAEDATMASMLPEPNGAAFFGDNYGCFLMHCGLSGMGHPTETDAHAHHGELPTARYDEASVEAGEDERGPWVAVTGSVTFDERGFQYRFQPRVVIRPGSPVLEVSHTMTNLDDAPLRYMYLCHVNFPLYEGGRLVQSVPYTPEAFRVVPDPGEDAETAAYTRRITADPAASEAVDPAMHLVPEYIVVTTPRADADGWAHYLEQRPDGRAAWVSFETERLPHAVRWIAGNEGLVAGGFCLPATSAHLGRTDAEANGQIQELGAGETHTGHLRVGLLDADDAARVAGVIDSLLS